MAISPKTVYPTQIDTTDPTGYPEGKAQNISAPGDGLGTPWEKAMINDILGFQQALLSAAGASPSGTPDKVGASQYKDALDALYNIIATTLSASQIVETDGSSKLISVAKGTAYNKAFGTTSGTVAEGDDSRFGSLGAALNVNNLFYIEDQKTNGTAGGASVAATQNVRDLNASVVSNITSASLSANQITLPAGTYWIEFEAPARSGVNELKHKARLRNITDASTPIVGSSEDTAALNNDQAVTKSCGAGLVTIGATKVFELQHYTSVSVATNGFGVAVSSGDIEVYSRIKIWKVG